MVDGKCSRCCFKNAVSRAGYGMHACNLSYAVGGVGRRILGKNTRPYLKNFLKKKERKRTLYK
jgi:hypothetical protein